MPSFEIALSTAMLPILAARAGMIPCQPTPPWSSPGTSCTLRGSTVASSRMPGIRTPWKRTGENSMTSPDQLISQPTTPVKTGTLATCHQSRPAAQSRIASSIAVTPSDLPPADEAQPAQAIQPALHLGRTCQQPHIVRRQSEALSRP